MENIELEDNLVLECLQESLGRTLRLNVITVSDLCVRGSQIAIPTILEEGIPLQCCKSLTDIAIDLHGSSYL